MYHYYHFKVRRGQYITGTTNPPIHGAIVTLQCLDPILLAEREPRQISTDPDGTFRYGPVPIAEYSVTVEMEDVKFVRDPKDRESNVFNFIAQRSPTLEVRA